MPTKWTTATIRAIRQNPLWRIVFLSDRSIKEARALYQETYRRKIEDRAIEAALHQVLREQDFHSGDMVTVPAQLVLAIVLRPRGKGRGKKRPPIKDVERWIQHAREFAVSLASEGWQQGVAAGKPRKATKDAVAKEVLEQIQNDRPHQRELVEEAHAVPQNPQTG